MATSGPTEIEAEHAEAGNGGGAGTEEPTIIDSNMETSQLRERETAEDKSESKRKKRVFLAIKIFFGALFFTLVLFCMVFSKLTLVSLTDKLRQVTQRYLNNSGQPKFDKDGESPFETEHDVAVSLYWQLLLVMTIPTLIALGRSLLLGVLGKSFKNFPWPKFRAIIIGVMASVLEVAAISVFVFLVMAELPPDISLLLLCGIVFCQIAVDWWHMQGICDCMKDISKSLRETRQSLRGYEVIEDQEQGHGLEAGGLEASNLEASRESLSMSTINDQQARIQIAVRKPRKVTILYNCFKALLENRIVKFVALAVQLAGMAVFIGLLCDSHFFKASDVSLEYVLRIVIAAPLCLAVLSVVWSNKFQDYIASANHAKSKTARYKSSFINACVRLLLYPIISYNVFRFATYYQIDPLCLDGACISGVKFRGVTLSIFITQIFTTLFAYILSWIACAMTLGPYSMSLPLLLSTPLSVCSFYIIRYSSVVLFPPFTFSSSAISTAVFPWGLISLSFLWLGQVLGIGFYLLTKRNVILSRDTEMFLVPYYDGIFLEQQMILNRQTKKYSEKIADQNANRNPSSKPRTIFICTTMYQEDADEMKQLLLSINAIAKEYERTKKKDLNPDEYESHIFFDGALNGTHILKYGLQLLALLEEVFGRNPANTLKKKTPYGMCLQYQLNEHKLMPFHIHFKDKNLVKPKKRWSQVMYMKYIIEHRVKDKSKLENTFILTTDADIDFKPKSAYFLLDMLQSNPQVGAVCARTHPKGSGPLYWYQVFDYAIGHWFQKPAEHLLGCVLCSPGCFSVFRCQALKKVLKTYSSLTTSGMEFLMKDMGEDRWLCTLLIKKGWRLEYCAVSHNKTRCPQTFQQFYAQRRRWIPSTVANLSLLFTDLWAIIRKNDTVSILFILFQGILVFSTAISPATVILVIASGLQSAFYISDVEVSLVVAFLIFVSILYGAVCLYSSPKAQIQVAKILTFLSAIIMVTIISGFISHTVNAIFHHPDLIELTAPNCSKFQNKSYIDCEETANFLDTLPIPHPFKLPVSISIIYFGLFAVIFLVAALLHPMEFFCVIHGIWYLLALPSGYLLLIIYSAANLDSQSWGTREGGSREDRGLQGWSVYFKKVWLWCCIQSRCCRPISSLESSRDMQCQTVDFPSESEPQPKHPAMDDEAREWLEGEECECSEEYVQLFEKHGYTSKDYIASMTLEDFEAIGIDKRGYRLRLLKAAARLQSFPINVKVPEDVASWLENLKMEEYIDLFEREGYSKKADVENLKGLKKSDLMVMGITKRAHLQRLLKALHSLDYPNKIEEKMAETKSAIERKPIGELHEAEEAFWTKLVKNELKPFSEFSSVERLKKSLRNLRNATLIGLFLINMMWILVLYIIKFPILADYGVEIRAFQLLFLAVYSVILVIQFLAMIFHRGITLVHKFGRITPKELDALTQEQDFVIVDQVPTVIQS